MSEKALTGVRVCDLTRFVSGPFCTLLMANLGAEVIKVEKGAGDASRGFGPFLNNHCIYYDFMNYNKKGVKVDYRKEEGMKYLKDLISKCDVVVENFLPGTMEKMGLSDDELKMLNPNIIITHISGFGQSGPYSKRPAFDCISQAMSGIMSVTGHTDDERPVMIGTVYHDYMAGTFAALSTVAALYHNKTLNPCANSIDVAMLDSALAYTLFATQNYILNDEIMEKHGNRDPSLAPSSTFKAKDGKYVMIHTGRQSHWEKFLAYIGKSELMNDEVYATEEARMKYQDRCEAVVQEWVSSKLAYDVENELASLVIPCAVVADFGDVVRNPHIKERGVLQTMHYPDGTVMPVTGPTIKMSATPCEIYANPPELGEHTEEIARVVMHYSEDKIKSLKENEVI